jgi:hypothetical protein
MDCDPDQRDFLLPCSYYLPLDEEEDCPPKDFPDEEFDEHERRIFKTV